MVQKMKIIPPLAHFLRSLSICFVEVGSGDGEGLCKEKNLQILDPQEYVANEQAHLFWLLVAKAGDDSSSMLEESAYFSLIIMYVCMCRHITIQTTETTQKTCYWQEAADAQTTGPNNDTLL